VFNQLEENREKLTNSLTVRLSDVFAVALRVIGCDET
jgi:hypothetical protein